MALQFKVETLDDRVRFRVKGVVIELSYHAASALCNTIFQKCDERKEFNSTKFNYWREQGRNGRKVNVRPNNMKQYEKFMANPHPKPRRKEDKPVTLTLRSEKSMQKILAYKREDAKRAKIKELQERFGIKPKKPNP